MADPVGVARTSPGSVAVVLALLLAAPASAARIDGSCTVKNGGKAACAKAKPKKPAGGVYDGGPGDPILRPISSRDERRKVAPF
jgi:hypothetical protein